MIKHKQLTLLLLKQVLWGVRRGNNHSGICDLFNRRLCRVRKHFIDRNMELDIFRLRNERRRVMKEAVAQLGWTYTPMFPVPHPSISDNQRAFNSASSKNMLWEGQYGINRTKLLCRMIWIIKTEIYLENPEWKPTLPR